MLGQDLRVDGIAGPAFAPLLDPRGVAGVRVAALNHESVDDPVEQDIVIVMREGQLDEVVPVLGRVLVQLDADGAHGGDDVEDGLLGELAPGFGQRGRVGLLVLRAFLGRRRFQGRGRQRVGRVSLGLPSPAASAGDGEEGQDGECETVLHITSR